MQRQGNSQKKIFLTGGRFFRKLFVFYKLFVGTQIVFIFHKLLGGTQIVSNFTSRLQAHNCFNFLQIVKWYTIAFIYKLFVFKQLLNFTSRLPVQIIALIFHNFNYNTIALIRKLFVCKQTAFNFSQIVWWYKILFLL